MSQKPLDRARLEEQRAAFMQALVGTFQARFHVLNKAGGLMQKDIAERLGKDPGYVSRMLAGQKNMTIQTAHDLARAMDSRLEMTLKPYEEMVPTDNRPHRGATSFDDLSGFSNTKAAKYAGPETNYATGS